MKGAQQQGFSLLELLVALIVVVLVVSTVSLSVSSGGQDVLLQSQLRNLADVASYALDEAQMEGRDYGLLLQQDFDDGDIVYLYAWRERHLDGWREPQSGKDVFEAQSLPVGIELQLELDGTPLEEIELAGAEIEPDPQVVFYASGEATPGALDVRHEEKGELLWRVQWDLLGRFELLPRGIEEEDEFR